MTFGEFATLAICVIVGMACIYGILTAFYTFPIAMTFLTLGVIGGWLIACVFGTPAPVWRAYYTAKDKIGGR